MTPVVPKGKSHSNIVVYSVAMTTLLNTLEKYTLYFLDQRLLKPYYTIIVEAPF